MTSSETTLNTLLNVIIPKLELEILADKPEPERQVILSGVVKGVREAFANSNDGETTEAPEPSEEALAAWHNLAIAIADVMECPETPARIVNELADLEGDIVELLLPPAADNRQKLAAHTRGTANEYMRMRGGLPDVA
jgi:hypothetical protein